MKVLGVTGGIGMGKSACADLMRARGIRVADTDQIAHDIVRPGNEALAEITKVFGSGILTASGELNRRELGRIVFKDKDLRAKLEGILHPRIQAVWRRQAEQWRSEGQPFAAIVIPLLFETGAETELDATICVACSERTQRKRLLGRGWDEEEIGNRIAAQMSVARKIELSTYVIWSEGSLEAHAQQLDRILGRFGSCPGN